MTDFNKLKILNEMDDNHQQVNNLSAAIYDLIKIWPSVTIEGEYVDIVIESPSELIVGEGLMSLVHEHNLKIRSLIVDGPNMLRLKKIPTELLQTAPRTIGGSTHIFIDPCYLTHITHITNLYKQSLKNVSLWIRSESAMDTIDFDDIINILMNSNKVNFEAMILYLRHNNLKVLKNLDTIKKWPKDIKEIDIVVPESPRPLLLNIINKYIQSRNYNLFVDEIIEAGFEDLL